MEHLRRVDQLPVHFLRPQPGIRAGFPGEGKGAVAPFIQGHKGQGGKHIPALHHATGIDSRLPEGPQQQPAEGVGAHLAQKGGFIAEFAQRRQKIGRRPAGVGRHDGIAPGVRLQSGKINQQFSQCHNIHIRSLRFFLPSYPTAPGEVNHHFRQTARQGNWDLAGCRPQWKI